VDRAVVRHDLTVGRVAHPSVRGFAVIFAGTLVDVYRAIAVFQLVAYVTPRSRQIAHSLLRNSRNSPHNSRSTT
jgi:hypothetical protein